MLPINRTIKRSYGVAHCSFVGLKAVFAAAVELRFTVNNTIAIMQPAQKQNYILPPFPPAFNTNTIAGNMKDFFPTKVVPVSGSDWEPLWDQWVRKHHYLGYRRLLGHRLKYLAFLKDRPVAALSWSAPALKLSARDRFIGWSPVQRKRYLQQLAANSRFLILPWVQISNLASHILALNIARLPADWLRRFNHRLLLLETFVDSRYFAGTCYKAANWLHIGHTQGSTKQGKGYRYHGNPKEVYLYVLDPNFRQIIDCRQQPAPSCDRPPTQTKVVALVMLLEHCRWHPQLTADLNLDTDDLETMAKEIVNFHQCFHDAYRRSEHHRLGLAYFSGLMSNAEAKSVEPIALEFLDQKSVRSMQMFLKTGRWDHDTMLRTHQEMLAPLIATPNGMITVDPSDFPKKGKESVGVARQYCGPLGKTDNCQSGVFVGYSSDKGYGLLNCQLYMPESWFSPDQEKRCQFNMVPEDLVFETKQQIAIRLIHEIVATKLYPAKWIGADAAFGIDIEFLNASAQGSLLLCRNQVRHPGFYKKAKSGYPAI